MLGDRLSVGCWDGKRTGLEENTIACWIGIDAADTAEDEEVDAGNAGTEDNPRTEGAAGADDEAGTEGNPTGEGGTDLCLLTEKEDAADGCKGWSNSDANGADGEDSIPTRTERGFDEDVEPRPVRAGAGGLIKPFLRTRTAQNGFRNNFSKETESAKQKRTREHTVVRVIGSGLGLTLRLWRGRNVNRLIWHINKVPFIIRFGL